MEKDGFLKSNFVRVCSFFDARVVLCRYFSIDISNKKGYNVDNEIERKKTTIALLLYFRGVFVLVRDVGCSKSFIIKKPRVCAGVCYAFIAI